MYLTTGAWCHLTISKHQLRLHRTAMCHLRVFKVWDIYSLGIFLVSPLLCLLVMPAALDQGDWWACVSSGKPVVTVVLPGPWQKDQWSQSSQGETTHVMTVYTCVLEMKGARSSWGIRVISFLWVLCCLSLTLWDKALHPSTRERTWRCEDSQTYNH